jgi:hypothetical protein
MKKLWVKVYRIRTHETRPWGDVSYLKGNQLDSVSVWAGQIPRTSCESV